MKGVEIYKIQQHACKGICVKINEKMLMLQFKIDLYEDKHKQKLHLYAENTTVLNLQRK